MKKLFGAILLVLVALFASINVMGDEKEQVELDYSLPQTFYVGEQLSLETNRGTWTYTSEDNLICFYSSRVSVLTFLKEGTTVLKRVKKSDGTVLQKYLITVEKQIDTVTLTGSTNLTVGQNYQFSATSSLSATITYSSSDDDIVSVNEEGLVYAKDVGMACITASSSRGGEASTYVIVKPLADQETKDEQTNVDGTNIDDVVSSIAKHSSQAMVSLTSYINVNSKLTKYDEGCAFVYKRVAHLKNGETVEDNNFDFEDVLNYEYFLITNKHLVTKTTYNILTQSAYNTDADKITLYFGTDATIDAKIVAYDTKVDVAVLTFESLLYFPTVKLGSSSDLKAGDFVISIGTATGQEFFNTVTYGIVSAQTRYLSDDTDGDGTNDWDAKYIQHDAAINSADCGSPLLNLKGEVIGINTAKKIQSSTGVSVENLSFAIPSDLLSELVPHLEIGEVPQRPRIGVTVLSILDILPNIQIYRNYYGYNIPDGLSAGFFVTEVTKGGIADIAGVKADDVILLFNDTKLTYMYELRALLDHYIVGSKDTATLTVLRGGEEILLTLVF